MTSRLLLSVALVAFSWFGTDALNVSHTCYEGNGVTYEGPAAIAATTAVCLKWTDTTIRAPKAQLDALRDQLILNEGSADFNYCRNPDGSESAPWCFTERGWSVCGVLSCDDECNGVVCFNGGTCESFTKFGGYACYCANGFEGDHCETNIDDCTGNPCGANGACVDGVATYTCQCNNGWSGALCDEEVPSKCVSGPCQNSGTCFDAANDNGYTCSCTNRWEGDQCQTPVSQCLSGPCKNGGTCTDSTTVDVGYTCACTSKWLGSTCETPAPQCDSNPCLNSGTCSEVWATSSYSCACTSLYEGTNCETKIVMPCDSVPCENSGTCTNVDRTTFTCDCVTGFSGTTCQNSVYNPWAEWSACTASCAGGQRTRLRTCGANVDAALCLVSALSETEACNTQDCPTFCDLFKFEDFRTMTDNFYRFMVGLKATVDDGGAIGPTLYKWINNTYDCGYHQMDEAKTCTNADQNVELASVESKMLDIYYQLFGVYWTMHAGEHVGQLDCSLLSNPAVQNVVGTWSTWSDYSTCNRGCGTGTQTRYRTCTDLECKGQATESIECYSMDFCTGSWSYWSGWSECTVNCGTGSKTRQRNCINNGFVSTNFYCSGDEAGSVSCLGTDCTSTKLSARLALACPNGHMCQTGVCISNAQKCDGVDDCLDGPTDGKSSDEDCCGDSIKWWAFGISLFLLLVVIILLILICCVFWKKSDNKVTPVGDDP